jgi:hypothetical protein
VSSQARWAIASESSDRVEKTMFVEMVRSRERERSVVGYAGDTDIYYDNSARDLRSSTMFGNTKLIGAYRRTDKEHKGIQA